MVRNIVVQKHTESTVYAECAGLSTDTKPTAANGYDVPHGSTWINMDDGSAYMYNKNNDTWYEV